MAESILAVAAAADTAAEMAAVYASHQKRGQRWMMMMSSAGCYCHHPACSPAC